MIVYRCDSDEIYKELVTKHKDAVNALCDQKDCLTKIVASFVKTTRNGGLDILNKTLINRDLFTGSLRRIELSYQELEKIPAGSDGQDQREIFSLAFFHNAKAFLEIVEKNFKKVTQESCYKDLYKTVTTIRNYFAHSYEKDFPDKNYKVVVRINMNHGNCVAAPKEGLYELEIFDFDVSQKIFSALYSLELIFSEICRIALKINNQIAQDIVVNRKKNDSK